MKRQKRERLRKPKKKRFYQRLLFWSLVVLIGGGAVGGKIVWDRYGETVQESVTQGYQIADAIDKNTLRSDKPTIIYDYQGRELKRLNTAADYQVKTEDFNPYLFKGFPATEDERYRQHHGVDLWAIARAAGSTLRGGSLQGGSTLTQQLVKNRILQNSAQTVNRKVTEMVVAQELEKKFSKDEILSSYLNSVYFGHGASGVGMAARYYFNKDQKDLTLRESAVVIGLTNNPTLYDPVTNLENSNRKVEEVLYKLYRNKVVTKEEYDKARGEETVLQITPLVNQKDYTDSYAISYAMNRAAESLAVASGFQLRYKFDTDEAYKTYHQSYNQTIQEKMEQLVSGGYNIYTSINPELQADLEQKVANETARFNNVNPETEKLDLQTSVTVLDNQTHNVAAIIGGRTTDGDYLNRAYQAPRQPGSTAKPIIAYTPAFENGSLLPQSTLRDSQVEQYPTVANASRTYSNRDWTVREGVNWSLNTIALRASLKTDIDKVTDKLSAMEFHNLHPYDNNNIIAIGGFTYGVTTTEMAGAYSALVNQGVFYQPSNVERVTSAYDDSVLYQNGHVGKKVYSQEASYAMLDVLKTSGNGATLYDARALATNYPTELQGGKTGTTDEARDVWFASVNHYYTTAVWVGADQSRPLGTEEQKEAKNINRIVTETVLAGKTPVDFKKPDTVNKNGDQITFTSQETVDTKTAVTATQFKADANAKQAALKEENKNRLANLDYRIYYGLSLQEEEDRESRIERELSEVNVTAFTSANQYEEYQRRLADIQSGLSQVKRASKKAELSNKLLELRAVVTERYSTILNQNSFLEQQSLNQRIETTRNNADQNNDVRISELEARLSTLKNSITTGNRSDINTDSVLSQLDEVVTELNSLGKQTPYYRVWTDGKNTLFVETAKPTLTRE